MPYIDTNHHSIYYELTGPDAGEAIVFLPGLTGDHNNWLLQVNSFKESYRCLTFDWRDTGLSAPSPCEEYSLRDMAADVAGMITGLNLGKSHLVGLSMGGAVAQEVALNYPQLVATVTIASSFSRRPSPSELPHNKRTPGNLRQSMAVQFHDTVERLPHLRLPVLVIAGSRDRTTPPHEQKEMAGQIPGAEYVMIERAGHTVQVEKAGDFNRTLRAFLEAHPVSYTG
ncbi:MAG TPA: alpha/beta hydrolase [Chloroflexia bacterium]|nr:alpha/beta hydrolase [Chloroflexia bacterium]